MRCNRCGDGYVYKNTKVGYVCQLCYNYLCNCKHDVKTESYMFNIRQVEYTPAGFTELIVTCTECSVPDLSGDVLMMTPKGIKKPSLDEICLCDGCLPERVMKLVYVTDTNELISTRD